MSAEMCFMRKTAAYTLSDTKRKEEIMRELQILQMTEYIEDTGGHVDE
jgi:hypothetical protein